MSSLLSRNLLKLIIMDSKALSGLLPRQHHCGSADVGERHIFNGHKSSPMFEMEKRIQLPELEEGEVLVKVRAATICISDIHTVTGARIEPTPRWNDFESSKPDPKRTFILNLNSKSVLGHEACVEIVDHKRDKSVFTLQKGDRATFSIADSCGECEFCQNDLSQKCVKLFKVKK